MIVRVRREGWWEMGLSAGEKDGAANEVTLSRRRQRIKNAGSRLIASLICGGWLVSKRVKRFFLDETLRYTVYILLWP